MAEQGYPVKDYMQEYKSIMDDKVEEEVMTNSMGDQVEETPLDMLRRRVKYDIELRVDWNINKEGTGKSITFSIAAIDTYSNKQVAAANGTGAAANTIVPRLIEQGLTEHMNNFSGQLMHHFEDIQTNGREITIQVKTWGNGEVNLDDPYSGDEALIDVINNWMEQNTIHGAFNLSSNTDTRAKFEQVRIPMFNEKGRAMDARMFATKLRQFLKKEQGLDSKISNKGLGEAIIILGER